MIRNRFSGYNAESVSLVSFRDLTTSAIGMLVGIVIMLALMIAPAQKKSDAEAEKFAGNLRVEIMWPNTSEADIDLWCKAPNDKPVGYSNKGGTFLNLVRDDLGSFDDPTQMNYEIIFSRGNPPGEYVCNVHWFGNSKHEKNIPVKMVVTYRKDDQIKSDPIMLVANTTLTNQGVEETMIRFVLEKDRNLVRSSINSIHQPLRSAK